MILTTRGNNMAKFGKSTASKSAMKAREAHWLRCKAQGLDIWEIKIGPAEL
jgi:hypothetical protein